MPGRQSIEIELREGTLVLESAGILNPKRDATAIWAALTRSQPGDVWLRRGEEASESDKARFREALARRVEGEPLPYVTGTTGFRKLDIKVDRRALIPRPETEGLVERVLEWGRRRTASGEEAWGVAVEIGTGTACIALSLAVEGEFERVVATEKSVAALELAAENVAAVASDVPVELRSGSLLGPLGDLVANAIVSNPPYVTVGEYEALDPSVRRFEPHEALVSGVDGLDHTRALLHGARNRLAGGGLLAIEVDSTRAGKVVELAGSYGWRNARVEDDLFGRPRFFLATKET